MFCMVVRPWYEHTIISNASVREYKLASPSIISVPKYMLKMGKSKGGYYAVRKGRSPGVYNSWNECSAQVTGYAQASFKRFNTKSEAIAFANNSQGGTSSAVGNKYSVRSSLSAPYSRPAAPSYGAPSISNYHLSKQSGSSSSDPSSSVYPLGSELVKSKSSSSRFVYVDGAARGNGKGNAVGGAGVYYGEGDPRNQAIPLPGTTNQKAELVALREGLRGVARDPDSRYTIYSDSRYALKSVNEWSSRWEKNGWKNSKGEDVANQDLIREVLDAKRTVDNLYQSKGWGFIELKHVAGHSGNKGNDAADALANEGADKASK